MKTMKRATRMTTQMLETTAETKVDVWTPAAEDEDDNTDVLYSVWPLSQVVVLVRWHSARFQFSLSLSAPSLQWPAVSHHMQLN